MAARIVAIFLLLTPAIANGSRNLNSYLAAHPISTQTAVPSVLHNNVLPPSVVSLVVSSCPASCDESGLDPNNWTVYHQSSRLLRCNQTMLLDFALFNSLNNPNTHQTIRSCTASLSSPPDSESKSCLPNKGSTVVQVPVQLARNGTTTTGSIDDFKAASQQLTAFLAHQGSTCNDTIAFIYSNSVMIGLFAGSGVRDVLLSVLEQFTAHINSTGISESALVQLCSSKNRSSKYSFGIIASTQNDLGSVQDAVATWATGKCITTYDSEETWQNIAVTVPTLLGQTNGTFNNGTTRKRDVPRKRSDCTTIQVVSGDSCMSSQNSSLSTYLLILVK
jgi:chitinase